MLTPVKNVIRFSIVSPCKKESQRVRQKQVPNRYEAEPANSAKMHAERSVKAASLQAKMEKTYTDSTQYFLEDPNKRITTNIWRIAASIVTRPATDEAVAIASKGGKSKAAVSRRKPSGTPCLGFMMQYLELVDRTSRKVVEFIMMLTDDTRQDAIQVLSGKYLLYSKFMPSHIHKTIFRSDGASCFHAL